MKLAALGVFAVLGLQSATLVQINCGSATDGNFTGGAKYTSANQSDLSLQPIPFNALRYGSSFSYTIPVIAGPLKITLGFLEIRNDKSTPPIGTGQRVFSVAINGQVVAPAVDLYVLAGSQKTYRQSFNITSDGSPVSIQLQAAAGKLSALISSITIEDVPPPVDGDLIQSATGTISTGLELVGGGPNVEIPIMTNIPGERRFLMVTVCSTVRFLGQSRVQVSVGRPGTNHTELTGAFVPLENADNNSNCWTAHPTIPQLIGPYDLVAYFEVFTQDGNGNEIPGTINLLSQGQMTWEILYTKGKIGALPATIAALDKTDLLVCSGSFSRVDPQTGKTLMSDCAGMMWVKTASRSIVGVNMVPTHADWLHWAPTR
jgi:hypothetical protein